MIENGFIVFVLFSVGAALGSFLHVVAERYMTNKSAFVGRSYCPYCRKTLTGRELVPIFSYIVSGARCSGCNAEIPVHYPLIELLTGILAVLIGMPSVLHHSGFLLPILFFAAGCVLIVLIRIDSRLMLLPDTYIYALTVLASLYVFLTDADLNGVALGVLLGAGSLYLLWIGTGGRGIGFGDVKLMIPLGILFGVKGVITLLFFSFFAGGAVSIFLLAAKRVTSKTAIPFGPFLAGSALLLIAFPDLVDRFFAFLEVY